MMRNKQTLMVYLLLAAALLGGVLWYEGSQVPRLGQVVSTGTTNVGGPFRLVDQTGKTRTDADFRGRFMLIYFGYSFCPDVCPTTLSVMAQALDALKDKRVRGRFRRPDRQRGSDQGRGEDLPRLCR